MANTGRTTPLLIAAERHERSLAGRQKSDLRRGSAFGPYRPKRAFSPAERPRDQAGTYVNLITFSPIRSLATRRSGDGGPVSSDRLAELDPLAQCLVATG